jgi:Reeler domain/Secretion system C-terminal sorting domain
MRITPLFCCINYLNQSLQTQHNNMSQKYIFSIFIAFTAILFGASEMRHPGGRARMFQDDNTGRPGANGTCGNCHGGGAFGTVRPLVTVQDDTGMPVSSYVPGAQYTVNVSIISTITIPNSYSGFQCVAVKSANNSTQAGSFQAFSANMWVSAAQNRQYAEHRNPSPSNNFSFYWTAPAAGFGSVTLFATGLMVNNTGSTQGDSPSEGVQVTLTENTVGIETAKNKLDLSLKINPNPVTNSLNLYLKSKNENAFDFKITDVAGRVFAQKALSLPQGEAVYTHDVVDLPKGYYIVSLTQNGKSESAFFIK